MESSHKSEWCSGRRGAREGEVAGSNPTGRVARKNAATFRWGPPPTKFLFLCFFDSNFDEYYFLLRVFWQLEKILPSAQQRTLGKILFAV